MASTLTPASIGKRSFIIMLIGVVLSSIAIVGWSVLGVADMAGDDARTWLWIPAVTAQVGAIACLLAATLSGIIALVRGARPRSWPVLAVLGIPIAGIVVLVELVVIWALFFQA